MAHNRVLRPWYPDSLYLTLLLHVRGSGSLCQCLCIHSVGPINKSVMVTVITITTVEKERSRLNKTRSTTMENPFSMEKKITGAN
jgi:hypothetical protein